MAMEPTQNSALAAEDSLASKILLTKQWVIKCKVENCKVCDIIQHMKSRNFTALFKKVGKFYAAWVEEVPGVNTQGKTLNEARENLKEALMLVLETQRHIVQKEAGAGYIKREVLFA